MDLSRPGVAITASVLAFGFALCLWTPVSLGQQATKVTGINGKTLHLFDSANGKRVGKIAADEVTVPMDILEASANGRYKVFIKPEGGEFWIMKKQARTDGRVKVTVDCSNVAKSYTSNRGFGNCK